MTPGEIARLLAAAAMFDYRKVEKADAQAWHLVLGDLDFDDAMEALRRHYAESTERLMPAHVRQGVRTIRNERRRPSEALALPSKFEDDMNRQVRMEAGAAQVREVLAEITAHLDRKSPAPVSARDHLRALTAGPAGADAEPDGADL
jgi:uncharacterized protein involved in exopolysaccharide biosynthesis